MIKAAKFLALFLLMIVLLLSCKRSGDEYEKPDKFLTESSGLFSLRIVEYLDYSRKYSVNIPPRIGRKTVKEIGKNSFGDLWFSEVTIPDTVVKIDDWAFSGNHIFKLILPKKLVEIGDGAFIDNELSGLVIPDSVKKIGYRAFMGNPLRSISIGSNVEFGELSGYNEYEGDWKYTPFEGTGFEDFYLENGRRAGIYFYNDDNWVVQFR